MGEVTLDISGMTREQAIAEFMRVLHIDRADAEFMVSIELGEVEGDVILVDGEDGAYFPLD